MKVAKPDNPEKEGFAFVEWQLNGETFDFETLIIENIIIIAKWEMNKDITICKVSFDSDGGSEVTSIQVAQGTSITAPIAPNKEGFNFIGWYDGNDLYDFSSIVNNDITLTAKWKNNKTITIEDKQQNNNLSKEKEKTDNIANNIISEKEECKHLNVFNIPNQDKVYALPTCTQKGYYLKYCPDCYKQWYEEADKLEHKIIETPYDNGYIEPTCSSDGKIGAKEYCYVCETIIKEGDSIPKNPYNHLGTTYIINKKDATWTQNGYSGDTVCNSCENNILSENKGSVLSSHNNHFYNKIYVPETDKIKYECSDGYVEYINPEPITISKIQVVKSLSLPGDGVKMIGFTIDGGSLNYSVEYQVIGDVENMSNRFYLEKASENSIWSYYINLKENSAYHIHDGTKFRIMIRDSSGRSFDKTFTVRRDKNYNYDIR